MNPLFKICMEEAQSSVSPETEVVVYAKVNVPSGLNAASRKEDQIQLEGQFANGVKCRVRATRKPNEDWTYTFTYKIKQDNPSGIQTSKENNTQVDKVFFEDFKDVATRKLVKTRYIFDSEKVTFKLVKGDEEKLIVLPNIQYEVDVYETKDGEPDEWCKIDIEIDSIIDYIKANHPDIEGYKLNIRLSHLPFEPVEAILKSEASEEDEEILRAVWDNWIQSPK